MTKVLTRGLSEQVAQSLGVRIVQGDFATGAKIDNEDTLGAEFGVSRTVIREAMKRLESKGLVEIRPRLGTTVQPHSRWSNLDPELLKWYRSAPPSIEVLLQLRELRTIVEPAGVALAASRCDDDDIERVMQAYGRMEKNVKDPEAFATADAEFHSELLRAARNDYLIALETVIATDLLSSIKVTNPNERKNLASLKFHLKVANAVAERDGDAAEKAMRTLLEDAGRRLKEAGKALFQTD